MKIGEGAGDVHYRISIGVLFFALKWRDWNFILRPRMSVPIPVGQTESDFRGRKRDRYPLALFPLFLPLQYPSRDEGGADWRNGERREG